jgi:pyruvate formate lyase activating enzyme
MLYPEYISALAGACRERGISVAIDTAGCVPPSSFEAVLPFADIFLYDIKALDPELHQKGTGKDNSLILQNLEFLIKAQKRIIIRIPVIPNFNDGDELKKIKAFCEKKSLPFEALPYHSYGESKAEALLP